MRQVHEPEGWLDYIGQTSKIEAKVHYLSQFSNICHSSQGKKVKSKYACVNLIYTRHKHTSYLLDVINDTFHSLKRH